MSESKNEWENFFDHHAPEYMDNVFTRDTIPEVNFVIEELKLPAGSRILDVGCGTGRHSVELARRGYKITGIDLSSGMLDQAKAAAKLAGVELELIHTDAREFKASLPYDAAICLCEGAFALIGAGEDPYEHDLAILRNIHTALKPKAGFILDTLSGFKKIRECTTESIQSGKFDLLNIIEEFSIEYKDDNGTVQTAILHEKGYIPGELKLLLRIAGFETLVFYGSTAGHWGRRPIDPDEIEMMAITRKI